MNISLRGQLLFWCIFLLSLVLLLLFLSDILLPFIAGLLLAYFLDPLVDRFESLGLPRLASVLLLVLFFLLLFVSLLFLILPVAYDQFLSLTSSLPSYLSRLSLFLSEHDILARFLPPSDSTNEFLREGVGWLGSFATSLWNSGATLLNVLSLLVITPIVAFYMLLDWDRMTAKVDSLLPRRYRSTIRELITQMDSSVSGFIRGQGTVCLILGAFYALALTFIGLDFGLLIGILSGLISFIPFVGALLGFLAALTVAFIQYGLDYLPLLVVAAVFGFGQFIEGNFLQPYLVGKRIGLHPVWLIFSLSAFGSLFGFLGLLIAVPLASIIAVLIRFGLEQYTNSIFYDDDRP